MLRRSHEIALALSTLTGGPSREHFAALHDDDATAEREYQRYAAHRALDQLGADA
jgi:hypothetical protein